MRKPFFLWDEKMSVGVKLLDDEHKVLIQLINELHDGIEDGHGTEKLGSILAKLFDYVKTHLSHEEEILVQNSYPELEDHLETHRSFIGRCNEIQQRYEKGRFEALSTDTMNFLKDWLYSHILGTDKRYQRHLNNAGVF